MLLYLMTECIDKKFGLGVFQDSQKVLRSKGNQKCLDQAKKIKNTCLDEATSPSPAIVTDENHHDN